LPAGFTPHHGIEDDEDLAHAGSPGHLVGLSGPQEPLIELSDDGIAAGGRHGAHVEHRTDVASSAPDLALSLVGTAVAVQRGNAHQGGDLAAVQGAEFRQSGDHRRGRDGAHAGEALEDLVLFAPQGAFADELAEVPVDGCQALFEDLDELLDVGTDPLGGADQTVLLRREHLDDLTAPGVEGLELAELDRLEGPDLGSDRFAETGQDAGIDGIGLGELSGGLGEVPDLPGVENHERQTLCGQVVDGVHLPAARGLEEHQGGVVRFDEVGQQGDAVFAVGKAHAFSGGCHGHIEAVLGDIDTDKDAGLECFHDGSPCSRPCGMRDLVRVPGNCSGLLEKVVATLASPRAWGPKGRTVCHDRENNITLSTTGRGSNKESTG